MTINSTELEGWLNRHNTPLPLWSCRIAILAYGETLEGRWHPRLFSYPVGEAPAEGYLGTVRTPTEFGQIGFHAWAQNDSEFIYYKLL